MPGLARAELNARAGASARRPDPCRAGPTPNPGRANAFARSPRLERLCPPAATWRSREGAHDYACAPSHPLPLWFPTAVSDPRLLLDKCRIGDDRLISTAVFIASFEASTF